MSNCNSCGSTCSARLSYGDASTSTTSGYTRVGALSSLCRSSGGCGTCGGCNTCNNCNVCSGIEPASDYPFYTGPCPPAPCNGCGCQRVADSCGCGSVAYAETSCSGCNSCQNCVRASGTCGCNTCQNCGCSACQNGNCNCGCNGEAYANIGYGVFAVNGPLSVNSGGVVGLNAYTVNPRFFAVFNGGVGIRQSGLYHAILTMDVPCGQDVSTTLQMDVDRQRLLQPELVVNTNAYGATGNYTGHSVFYAAAGSVLRIITQSALAFADAAGHPIITLTLVRLSN